MYRNALACCLLLTFVLSCSTLYAQPASTPAIPESFYSAMQWRCIGPHRGGRVLAGLGVSAAPAPFSFRAAGRGGCETTDGPHNSEALFDCRTGASIRGARAFTSASAVL